MEDLGTGVSGLIETIEKLGADSSTHDADDPFQNLKTLRNKHPTNIIISYINMNSIRKKFTNFIAFIQNSVDVLVIAEAKLDDSFSRSQFEIPGFNTPYRLDISSSSGAGGGFWSMLRIGLSPGS